MWKTKRLLLLSVRVLAFAATFSAFIVMATSHQRSSFLGISFEANYTQTSAFKYFLIVYAIVSVYGFLVLFLPPESLLWRLAIALDLVFTVLLSSGVSAALAVAYVGQKGNSYAGWLPICGQVPHYCNQVKGALIAGFIGLIVYMLLLLYEIHTVLDPLLLKKT